MPLVSGFKWVDLAPKLRALNMTQTNRRLACHSLLQLLWKGKEAMQAALELLDAAEQERLRQGTKPFVWKTGMVRPAHTLRQAVQFHKATSSAAASDSGDPLAEPITSQRLQQLIQGVQCFSMATEQTSTADVAQEKQIPSKQQPDVGDASSCVAASNWTHIAAQAAIGAVKDAVKGAVACAVVGVVLGAAWGALLVFLLCAVFQSVFYPILALLAFGFGSGVKSMDDAFKGAYEDLCYEGAREGAVSGAKIGVLLGAIVGAIAGAVRAAIKATSAQSKGKAVSAALACTLPVAGKVAGIVIPEGVTIDVPRYAEALWASCKRMAADRMDGSTAEVHIETVHSVTALHASASGPYDAVVVAAGAAVDTIQELQGVLPIQICQVMYVLFQCVQCAPLHCTFSVVLHTAKAQILHGASIVLNSILTTCRCTLTESPHNGYPACIQGYTLTMRPGSCKPYPHDAPSILGQTYIAAHGPHSLVVGATKSYGWSPQQALAMCHPRMSKVASGMHDKNRDIASPTTNINNNNTSGSRIGTSSDEARGISRQFRCQNDLAGAPGDTPAATHSTEAVAAAKEELMAGAALAWPPITGWDVYEVR